MNIYNDIKRCIDTLQGDFVVPKNAYEKKFCDLFGWTCKDNRFYDAIAPTKERIEIKSHRCGLIWFAMRRFKKALVNKIHIPCL